MDTLWCVGGVGLLTLMLVSPKLVPRALTAIRQVRLERAIRDPRRDPAAADFDDEDRAFLDQILAQAGSDDAGTDIPHDEARDALDRAVATLHMHQGESELLREALADLGRSHAHRESAELWAAYALLALKACYSHNELYYRGGLSEARFLCERATRDGQVDGAAIDAMYLARLGEIDAAEQALAALPADHWRACHARAIVYRARGDRERAIAALDAAADFAPETARSGIYNTIGNWLSRWHHADEALDAYLAATEINPHNAWAWHNLSLLHYDQGDLDEAIACNGRAMEHGDFGAARDFSRVLTIG